MRSCRFACRRTAAPHQPFFGVAQLPETFKEHIPLCLSARGDIVAVLLESKQSGAKSVALLDATLRSQLARTSFGATFKFVRLSPDGAFVCVTGEAEEDDDIPPYKLFSAARGGTGTLQLKRITADAGFFPCFHAALFVVVDADDILNVWRLPETNLFDARVPHWDDMAATPRAIAALRDGTVQVLQVREESSLASSSQLVVSGVGGDASEIAAADLSDDRLAVGVGGVVLVLSLLNNAIVAAPLCHFALAGSRCIFALLPFGSNIVCVSGDRSSKQIVEAIDTVGDEASSGVPERNAQRTKTRIELLTFARAPKGHTRTPQ